MLIIAIEHHITLLVYSPNSIFSSAIASSGNSDINIVTIGTDVTLICTLMLNSAIVAYLMSHY